MIVFTSKVNSDPAKDWYNLFLIYSEKKEKKENKNFMQEV